LRFQLYNTGVGNPSNWYLTSGPIGFTQKLRYVKKCNSEVAEENQKFNSYNSTNVQYTPYEGNRGLTNTIGWIWSNDYYNWNFTGSVNSYGPYIFSAGY